MSSPREISPLEKYLEIYANAAPNSDLKKRPFDYMYYKNLENEYFKENPPFAKNASAIEMSEVNTLLTTPSLENINSIREMMDTISEDLNTIQISGDETEKKKIKEAYIFNAFNRHLLPLIEEASARDDVQAQAELNKQLEMLRIISRDFVNNLGADKSLSKIETSKKKIDDNFMSYVSSSARGVFDEETTHKRQLADVNAAGYSTQRIELFGRLGKERIEANFNPNNNKYDKIRFALADAWSREAFNTQANLKTDPIISNHEFSIQHNEANDDFAKLASFAKDILSIQKNYEHKFFGLKEKFFKSEAKSKIVEEINNKLIKLIEQYPQKNRKEIVEEMKLFLEGKKSELENTGNSALTKHIKRTVDKLTLESNKEAMEAKKSSKHNVAPKEKPSVIERISRGFRSH